MQRHRPGRRGRDLPDGLGRDRERNRDAVADIARPFRLAGAVDRGHQDTGPGRIGAAHQVERDGMVVVREAVELEPEHVRREHRDALDRGIGGRGEHIGDARPLGRLRQIFLRPRPHQSGRSHGGDPDRRRIAGAEQLDRGRDALGVDAVARQQLDRPKSRDIACGTHFIIGAAIDEVEGEARHPPAGAGAQIIDGRKTPPPPRRPGVHDGGRGGSGCTRLGLGHVHFPLTLPGRQPITRAGAKPSPICRFHRLWIVPDRALRAEVPLPSTRK